MSPQNHPLDSLKTLLLFVLGVSMACALACGMVTPAIAERADNSIRFAFDQTLGSIDPYFKNLAGTGGTIADNVWDTLIYVDPATGEYKGELATAWRWLDDRTLELDLREGVKFHNGAAFDANDVAYTVNFVAKSQNKIVAQGIVRWIDHAEIVNAYKVRIVAKRPFPAAIAYLASPRFVIYPHEYYAKVGPNGMNAKPVGTGPYRVAEHALGKFLRLERNPDYFKDSPKRQPKVDRVDIRFILDAQTRIAEMIAGSLDLTLYVARDQAEQLRTVPNLNVGAGESTLYAFLALNSSAPQLHDVRVRQAIAHAIDRETIVKFLIGESVRVLHAECFPVQFGCDDAEVPRYAYNPDKARVLLADAGYPQGFDIDIFAFRDRVQTEAIIGYLSAVGIRAHLRFMESGALTSALRAGKVPLATLALNGSIRDVSNSVSIYHEFSADDISRDAEVRDLLLRGDSSTEPNMRRAAYATALKRIAEQAYTLPLYSLPNYYLAAKELDFVPSVDLVARFYEMSWK